MVKQRTRSIYIAIICMAVIACVGATFAWLSFSARQEKNANIAVVDLNTTIELTSLQSIGAGDIVANNISFSRKDNSSDFYVRARLYYDKDTKTQDELKYIMVLNSQPIAVNNASESYKWVLNDTDGYYYLVNDLTNKTPLKVASTDTTTYVFASNVIFEGAVGLYSTIAVPTELKAKASIEAIQAKNITPTSGTITLEELTPYFVDTFGYETPKGFVVNYHANGGSTVNSEVFFTLDATPSLPSTSKLGYGFKGWYTDADCTTPFVAGTILTHDYNLYAKWGDMTVSVVGTDGAELISVPNFSGDLASLVASNATLQSGYNVYYDSTFTQGVDLYDNIAGRTLYLEEYTPNINMTLSSDGKAYEIAPVQVDQYTTEPAVKGTFETLILPQYKYDSTTNTALPVTNILSSALVQLPKEMGEEVVLTVKTIKFTKNNVLVNNAEELAPAVILPMLENILVDSGSVYTIKGNSLVKDDTLVLACLNTTFTSDITKIGDCAFAGLNITSINIPNTITEVGAGAFVFCVNLAEITLSSSLTEIPDFMCTECLSLKHIDIPNSVTRIGTGAFMFCSFLESVTFPSSLKEIGEQAFSMNECLSEVVIPEGVTTIGNYAFIENRNLMSVSIPKSVITIGEDCIAWSPKLVHVRWLSDISFDPDYFVFSGMGITDYEIVYDSSAFKNRLETTSNGLITYTVGDKKYLMGLTNTANRSQLIIPDTITDIWQCAFNNYFISASDSDQVYTFTSIVIPSFINSIGKNAFGYIESLTSVTFEDATNWVDENGNAVDVTNASTNAQNLKAGTGYVKQAKVNFIKPDNSILYTYTGAPATLTEIVSANTELQTTYNFYHDSAFEKGILANTTLMGGMSVYLEEYTQGINVVNGKISPNSSALAYTGSETNLILPQFSYENGQVYAVTDILCGAFSEMAKMPYTTDDNGIKSIKISCNINNIEITSSNTAFSLPHLSSIKVDKSNSMYTSIENGVECNAILTKYTKTLVVGCATTKVTSIKKVGNFAFTHCLDLQNITIPNSVIEIGDFAFAFCQNLQSFTMPTNLKRLGIVSFQECNTLTTITIPTTVEEIGVSFNGCDKLTNIIFEDNTALWVVKDLEDTIITDNVSVSDSTQNATNLVSGDQAYNGIWYKKSA